MAPKNRLSGRPPKYSTVEELQSAIDNYFTDCEGEPLLGQYGEPVIYKGQPVIIGKKPPTVTSVA